MIRRKVAERLQARRRAGTGGSSDGSRVSSSVPSSSTADAVFSVTKPAAARQTSDEGFLFVDDRDTHSDSADDIEDHEALRQAVADDISGFDVPGALDDIGGDDFESENREEERTSSANDPPPRPKPPDLSGRGRARSGAVSVDNEEEAGQVVKSEEEEVVKSKPSSKPPTLKPWQQMSEKEVYEQQLGLMQEQLMTSMVEKEELKSA